MRILHTVAFYPPAVAGGGATHVVQRISEELARRRHDVTVATTFCTDRPDEYTLNGVAVRQFRVWGILQQSVLGIRGETENFLRFIGDGNFDIIMNYAAQTWHTDLTCQCLPDLKARAVLAACGYSGLSGLRSPLYRAYFRRLPHYLRQYDAVIYHAPGYHDERFGARHGIKHFRIIPNGFDSSELTNTPVDFRAHHGIETPHILLTVGDHFRNKGHGRVLNAFIRMKRSDATLIIIGRRTASWPSDCWTDCLRAAKQIGPRVVLLDQVPRSHVLAAYNAATLFLSGSHVEAFPLVILEAMAAGVPFVAFPAGNIADLPGGMIVTSERAMATTASKLLDDPGLRRQLGDEGLNTQRTLYEWETVVSQYEDLYRDLLAAPKRIHRDRSQNPS